MADETEERRARFPEWAAVALILLFALLFAFRGLTTYPAYWFDESLNIGQARNLAEAGYLNLQTAPGIPYEKPYHLTTGYPVVAPLALVFKLFGFEFAYARLYMIGWLLFFFSSAYVLAREYFGKTQALFSLALLATFAPIYGNGETVIAEVPAVTLLFWGALLLRKANARTSRLFAAGLLLGLSMALKPLYLLLIPALALSFFLSKRTHSWRGELLLWLGCALPVLLYVYTILPPAFIGGGSGASIMSFWQSRVAQGHLFQNLATNLPRLVTESSLLYTLLLGAAFVLAVPRRRLKERTLERSLVVLTLYGAFMFLFFMQSIGWNRYLVPVQAILLLSFPAALLKARHFLYPDDRPFSRYLVPVAFTGLLLMQTIHLFFFATIWKSTAADEFAVFFEEHASAGSVYVVNSSEAAAFVPSMRLYQYLTFFEPSPPMQNLLARLDEHRFDHLLVSKEDPSVTPYLPDIENRYKESAFIRGFTLYDVK